MEFASLTDALESLRAEMSRLSERLAALESAVGATPPAAPSAPSPPLPVAKEEHIGEELLLVISAALAAYLGVKPHIRQIRILGGATWSQQGRVTIQASHALPVRRP